MNRKPRTQTMRPYWKGYLKLALVSCPIALHAACSSAERIAFREAIEIESTHVIALEPYGKGLLGTTLRYPYEVRDAKDYFGDLPELLLAPDMLVLATQILQ